MQNSNSAETTDNLNKVIKIDEAKIRNHLGEMVRSTVEETLNDMLDAEPQVQLPLRTALIESSSCTILASEVSCPVDLVASKGL